MAAEANCKRGGCGEAGGGRRGRGSLQGRRWDGRPKERRGEVADLCPKRSPPAHNRVAKPTDPQRFGRLSLRVNTPRPGNPLRPCAPDRSSHRGSGDSVGLSSVSDSKNNELFDWGLAEVRCAGPTGLQSLPLPRRWSFSLKKSHPPSW